MVRSNRFISPMSCSYRRPIHSFLDPPLRHDQNTKATVNKVFGAQFSHTLRNNLDHISTNIRPECLKIRQSTVLE